MMPDAAEFEGSRRFQSLDEGIAGADVVMMLRIQHERAGGGPVDVEAYHREFGLTAARLATRGAERDRHAPRPDEPRRRDRPAMSPTARSP